MAWQADETGAGFLSVVIPAYNEEQNVDGVYQAVCLALAGEALEVIFVDDGSSDGTAERVRQLRVQNGAVRLIRFSRNFGQQPALIAGLEAARGAAVITLDCDLQHPPELLPRMLQAWRGGAKVVQMVRTSTAGAGTLKQTSSRLFYRFLNLVSETQVQGGAADYQLLDRAVVEAVLQFRDRNPFLRGLVAWLGFPVVRIDYAAPERTAGKSGYTVRKMLRLSIQAVTGLSSKPLRLSFYFGLLAVVLCVIYATFAVIALAAGRTVPGWTSVIVLVTFLGAVQLVSIGIAGEYIARIYEQTRGVPRYVIVEEDGEARPAAEAHQFARPAKTR
jgi:glycosyltransferase involved in cell wall biosynthesis